MKIKRIDIYERSKKIGNYVVENNSTVRKAAKVFGVSKSTVYKDVTERLEKSNSELAKEVRKVLDINKSERHIRGGEVTRQKYLKK